MVHLLVDAAALLEASVVEVPLVSVFLFEAPFLILFGVELAINPVDAIRE